LPGEGAVGTSPDDRLPLDDRLAFWTDRVAAQPNDFLSLTQLAQAHVESARLTADLAGYQRAAELIDAALAVVPAYPPTIRARGAVRYAMHDFRGALADGLTVLTVSPDDVAAIALTGDAALELGDLTTAEDVYDRLEATSPGPWLDVRLARLASARGDHAGALALARKASGGAASADSAEAGFYAYAVGEYARLAGDAEAARVGYEEALRARPTDLGALVGLARVDAFEGRTNEAIAGLRRASTIVPQPETLALLGDVLGMRGDRAEANDQFDTVRLIGQLGDLQGSVYDRVIMRFELDHGGATTKVLDAARASLAARPDWTGHDTLAWALYRLGRFEEAAAEIAAARGLGADDARLRFHEGAILVARGAVAEGERLLSAALDLGPALDPAERAEAQGLLAG
jgi:tetratricopeptide (TPR) repeat protein